MQVFLDDIDPFGIPGLVVQLLAEGQRTFCELGLYSMV